MNWGVKPHRSSSISIIVPWFMRFSMISRSSAELQKLGFCEGNLSARDLTAFCGFRKQFWRGNLDHFLYIFKDHCVCIHNIYILDLSTIHHTYIYTTTIIYNVIPISSNASPHGFWAVATTWRPRLLCLSLMGIHWWNMMKLSTGFHWMDKTG